MLQAMIRRLINLLAVFALLISPAHGEIFGNQFGYGFGALRIISSRATCVSDVSNLTTYTFSSISTGYPANLVGRVIAIVGGEDSAITFTVSSATIEGSASTVAAGSGGTLLVATAAVTSPTIQSGLDSVDVAVTFSEAVTGAFACVWVVPGGVYNATQQGAQSATSAAMSVSLAIVPGGAIFGACIADGIADSNTWTALDETEDTQNAEFDYSSAERVNVNSGEAATNRTCDFGTSATADSAMSVIALAPSPGF
jgi:hypothetical protein